MTYEEAKAYLDFGAKEGRYDAYDFEEWTEEEVIEFATKEMAKGDALANDHENEKQ